MNQSPTKNATKTIFDIKYPSILFSGSKIEVFLVFQHHYNQMVKGVRSVFT